MTAELPSRQMDAALYPQAFRAGEDPNTLANYQSFTTSHIHFDLTPDFHAQILHGFIILTMIRLVHSCKLLILDTEYLNIKKIYDFKSGKELDFTLSDEHRRNSQALTINLPESGEDLPGLSQFEIKIEYETSSKTSAIQWLTPEQTLGKKHPYLFTQLEPIHARAMFPCQDTPAVKSMYSAVIHVPNGMTAVMSALLTGVKDSGKYEFEQPIPVPAYLVALAVGNIHGKEIGPRSFVYAEPEILAAAAREFEDTEKFLSTAETIITPYIWGRYDVLVLPPGFPFGGMENPCLTFVTPALLAGDKSLVDVIIHEISHSWTGNLVTNESWEHFWLNEGFTMYLERLIVGKLYGEKERQFNALIGKFELQQAVEGFGPNHPFTALVPNLSDRHPDDAFSRVPYEKGFTLLYYLETIVNDQVLFERYLAAYIAMFSRQSISTEKWKSFFMDFFKYHKSYPELLKIDWNVWLYGTGLPPVMPNYDRTLLDEAQLILDKWMGEAKNFPISAEPFMALSIWQKAAFLDLLLDKKHRPSSTLLAQIDDLYNFTCNKDYQKNAEIMYRWLELVLKCDYYVQKIADAVAIFLKTNGRMKYIRPIYKALSTTCSGIYYEKARSLYLENRSIYHPIAQKMVEQDLHLSL